MTREEAITKIFNKYDVPTSNPFFFEILKALEQEPCEDAISKADVKNAMYKVCLHEENKDIFVKLLDEINKLQPVNAQVSCENAISRQATIEAFQMFRGYEANRTNAEWVDRIETIVKKLPPVNPQEPKYCDRNICVSNEYNGIGCDECEVTKSREPKTGHWMIVHRKGIYTHLVCDKCLSNAPYDCRTNYCPNCGVKMVEQQERSDKE